MLFKNVYKDLKEQSKTAKVSAFAVLLNKGYMVSAVIMLEYSFTGSFKKLFLTASSCILSATNIVSFISASSPFISENVT